ncbi:PilZ domain-containing protein [Cohnella sp. GCM10027633]|uniref:PilZ domain-containing protein n=1 Tax=unclassified Cohnella TaxID=2636738 RepID=UPI00363CA79F
MEQEERQNRREHVRFSLSVPLYGELSLHRVGEQEIRSRTQKVLLDDISYGGCLFRTHLQIPPRSDVEWVFKLQLGTYSIHLKGTVLRARAEEEYFLYGVRWNLSAYESHLFRYRLNEYMLATYAFGPHIQTLYRKLAERSADPSFKRMDYTT